MTRVALIAGAVFAVLLFIWWVSELVDERSKLRLSVSTLESSIKQYSELKILTDAKLNQYDETIRGYKDERDKLQKCVDSGSCGMSVRVLTKNVCHTPNGDSSGDTGPVETALELTGDSRRAYFSHRAEIAKANAAVELCLGTLENWRIYMSGGVLKGG